MFDTKQTDYRITAPDVPFHANPKADVSRAVFDAFRAQGFGIGAYFSKPDWHHPDFWAPEWATPDRNVNYSIDQVSRALAALPRLHLPPDRGDRLGLRPARHPLARRRLGPARADDRDRAGVFRQEPEEHGHRHAEDRGHGPAPPARPACRRPDGHRPVRELSHARTGGPGEAPPLRLGDLHDHGRLRGRTIPTTTTSRPTGSFTCSSTSSPRAAISSSTSGRAPRASSRPRPSTGSARSASG